MKSNNLLHKILTDEKYRQTLFPVTRDKVYLAHAAVGPLPACVSSAITQYVNKAARDGQFGYLHQQAEKEARCMAAKLMGSSSEEIAFVSSTSAGLNTVASGLSWRPGDNIVIADGDFPSNIYPWLNLQRKGVNIRFIPRKPNGLIELQDIEKQIDKKTRLVSLSSIHFSVGTPVDIDETGKFLHSRGILFCVDAIQSLGAMPCSVHHVDFLTADAHKWLLGPQGIGVLFVRREHFSRLHPPYVGWKSVRDNTEYTKIDLRFPDLASQYEPGGLNILGLIGLHAALKLIIGIQPTNMAKQIADLRAILVEGLQKKGYQIQGEITSQLPTGIVSFNCMGQDTSKLYQKLNDKGIITSLRNGLKGEKCIRVSPHFYNTKEEINILLKNL